MRKGVRALFRSGDLDEHTQVRSAGKPAVTRDERSLQNPGQRHIGGIAGAEVGSQFPHARQQGTVSIGSNGQDAQQIRQGFPTARHRPPGHGSCGIPLTSDQSRRAFMHGKRLGLEQSSASHLGEVLPN